MTNKYLPNVREKTGRAELSIKRETQFPIICGETQAIQFDYKEPQHLTVRYPALFSQLFHDEYERSLYLREGSVLCTWQQTGEEWRAVEADDRGDHEIQDDDHLHCSSQRTEH